MPRRPLVLLALALSSVVLAACSDVTGAETNEGDPEVQRLRWFRRRVPPDNRARCQCRF